MTSIMQGHQPASQEIPVLDHINQALLDELAVNGSPPIYTLTPDEARSVLLRVQPGSKS